MDDDSTLAYRLEIDPAETVRALHEVRRAKGRRWLAWALPAMMLLNAGLALASGSSLRDLWLLGLAAAGYGLFALAVPRLLRWQYRRAYAGTPSLRVPQLYRLSHAGVVIDSGPTTTSLGWDAFVRAMETREFFLLFYNQSSAYYLPKRVIGGPAEQSALRALLDAHLGTRSQPSPGPR